MTTGERIGKIAQEKQINLHKLSKLAGVSYNTLYSIVRRKSEKIDADIIERVAEVLGVSVSELVYGGTTLFIDPASIKKEYAENSEQFAREAAEAFAKYNELLSMEGNRLNIPLVLSDKFLHQPETIQLLYSFNHLNEDGMRIAVERVEELALIPKYQRTEPLNGLEADGGDTAPKQKEKPSDGLKKPNDGIRGNTHD